MVSESMSIFEVVRSLPQLLSSIPIDDSSISVLAMLGGIIGGWTLTGVHQKLQAKRVKARKQQESLRKLK
jgi:hypothetical protein